MTGRHLSAIFVIAIFLCVTAKAQTTEFTYQGSLASGGMAANGNFDLEFKLFDAPAGGGQHGPTLQRLNVSIANGIFAVSLDFGSAALPGADRFLDISVRPAGGGAFTPLLPRQKLSSAPYAIKSLSSSTADTATNANQLGGVAANQFVLTTDPRMTDARDPLPNSANYIQNRIAGVQTSSNFNISGSGFAGGTLSGNVVNSITQFNVNGSRVLAVAGVENTFAGIGTGPSNMGGGNSFFGHQAGNSNSSGQGNSFFGRFAGLGTTSGSGNSFFGNSTAIVNTTGSQNSFFGEGAGFTNTSGGDNVFIGALSAQDNTVGSRNTIVGARADVGANNLTNATAIGAHALVAQSNSLVLGSINGINGATASTNVGIGTTMPVSRLHVAGNTSNFALTFTNSANTAGRRGYRIAFDNDRLTFQRADDSGVFAANHFAIDQASGNIGINTIAPATRLHISDNGGRTLFGGGGCNAGFTGLGFASTLTCTNYSLLGDGTDTIINATDVGGEIHFRIGNSVKAMIDTLGNVGLGTTSPNYKLDVVGDVRFGGSVFVGALPGGGAQHVCGVAGGPLMACSSSLRYKSNIGRFLPGLSIVSRLTPIAFEWKRDGMRDLGLAAEDVADIEPLLVTYNQAGQVEGVKYDRLSIVLINAINEQQAEIESQRKVNEAQQKRIADLERRLAELENRLNRP